MHNTRRNGFTVIELLIVVAIIAIIAATALPRVLGARLSANETSAIATMRAIVTASQFAIAAQARRPICPAQRRSRSLAPTRIARAVGKEDQALGHGWVQR